MRTRSVRAVSLAAACLMALSACGGDNKASTATSSSGAGSASSTAPSASASGAGDASSTAPSSSESGAGAASSTAASSSDAPVGASGELTVWTGFSGGDRGAYEDIVKSFNESHPNIKVTMEIKPWDVISQTLPAAWATGQGPDVATPNFDPNVVAQYIKTGSVMALDDAVGEAENQINKDKLSPAAIKAFTADGKLYAVPANVATLSLYYNKKAFADAGIAKPPATADEFRDAAVKLTKDGTHGLSLADHETIQMWPVLQWIEGGDIVDDAGCAVIDSPEGIKSLQTWSDLVTKSKISPVGLTGAESDSLFAAGKAAMQINGPWAAGGYKKAGIDFGVAAVPAGAGGPVTLGSTVPLMVSKKTKNAAAATEFLAYWTSATVQGSFAKASGFPPVRTDMADNADLAADPVVSQFASALATSRLYLPGVKDATKIDGDVYVPLIGKITRGGDVAKEARAAAEQINSITGCKK